MKTILLLIAISLTGNCLAQSLYIHPQKSHGWMDSTVTTYKGRDAQGYTIPSEVVTTAELSIVNLARFTAIVGYFIQEGGGAWDANLVIAEEISPAIVTPPIVNEEGQETTPAVTRRQIKLAITVHKAGEREAEKTEVRTTESLPPQIRDAAVAMFVDLLE